MSISARAFPVSPGSTPSDATRQRLKPVTYRDLFDPELVRNWSALLACVPSAGIFATPQWQQSWWQGYKPNAEAFFIAFFKLDHEIAGLAPLMISTENGLRRLRLLSDGTEDSDNLEVLAVPGFEHSVVRSLFDYLQEHHSNWDIASFNTIPTWSLVTNAVVDELALRKWTVNKSATPCCAITLAETWEEYLKGISAKERGKIRYRERKLFEKYKVTYDRCADPALLDQRLQSLFDLHTIHWNERKEAGSFMSAQRREFYKVLSSSLLQTEQLELWTLELDGKAVASQYAFRYGDCAYTLQEGFDPAYNSDSVGYVLRAHVLRSVIERGVRRYDFLGGLGESKLRWGAVPGEYANVDFAITGTRGARRITTQLRIRKIADYLRPRLPSGLFGILKRVAKGS